MNLKSVTVYQHALLIGTLLLSSCSNKPPEGGNSTTNLQIVSSTPPFQTKEPQQYQATRTVTFTDSSGTVVTKKTLIARSEILRREETEGSEIGHVVFLELDKGRFVLLPDAKIYSEITDSPSIDSEDFENSPERLLHPGDVTSSYQKLATETSSGRKITKYRVVVNSSTGENVTPGETLIWVDESLGMPVRSETKASDGSHVVMELSNIVLETDKNLFRVPEGYAKVPASELRRRLAQKPVR